MRALSAIGRKKGRFRSLPLAGGWTRHRDFPAPQGRTFQERWKHAAPPADVARGGPRRRSDARSASPDASGRAELRSTSAWSARRGASSRRAVRATPPSASPSSRRWWPMPRRRSPRWQARPMSRSPSPSSCAATICLRPCAAAATPASRRCPGAPPRLEVSTGRSDGDDVSAVSHALAGVAETGTLVLVSGHGQSVDAQFPARQPHRRRGRARHHGRLRGDVDAGAPVLRQGSDARTVNWITGPSRSADIEQTILLGAHGPRRLHVVVVNG